MRTTARLTIAALFFSASAAVAQDAAGAMDSVRQLYASAEYEEALTALARLQPETPTSGLEIDRYRALCLIALNRTSEADRVIESIVATDPLYQPSATDASPRVRAAFSAVRDRVLPAVAKALYLEAKAAYDRKAYTDAAQALERTVRVIDTMESPAKNDLADLRVLASGFLDLSKAAAAPPPPTAPAAPAEPAKPVVAAPPPAPAAPPNTGLVVLKQNLPPLPFSIASLGSGEYRGVVELQIDESGNVTSARILQTVHVLYDPILLNAAREWKYEAPRVAWQADSYGEARRDRVEAVATDLLLHLDLDPLEYLGLGLELRCSRRKLIRIEEVSDDVGLLRRRHRARSARRHRDSDALEQVAGRQLVPVAHEIRSGQRGREAVAGQVVAVALGARSLVRGRAAIRLFLREHAIPHALVPVVLAERCQTHSPTR